MDLIRWGPLADLLRQGGLDPVAVSDTVAGRGPLAPVVSGSLDADRMDYLLRDAHHAGMRSSVDVDRLVEVVARDERHGIVLDESGTIAAEGLLTMRFLMYPAVYLHHTVRASEGMLLAAIRHHLRERGLKLADLERETDDGLLGRLRSAGGTCAELVARLDERRLYKRAREGRPEEAHLPLVKDLQDDHALRLRLAAEIADAAGVPHHHALLDVPKPPKFREAALHVRFRDGTVRPLPEASRLVRVLQEARFDHWRWWVFSPKQDRDAVARAAEKVLGLPAARPA